MLKLIICVTCLLITTDVVQCESGYYYMSELDGWVAFHTIPATWEEAYLRCHFEGVPLSDMTIRYRNLQGNHAASRMLPGSDGSTADPGSCMTMDVDDQTYYMYTSSCSERHPYVCYRKGDAVTNACGTYDYDYHLNQDTGSCYKFHGDYYHTWTRAHMICAAEGGYLVILNNQEEADYVKTLYTSIKSEDRVQVIHIGIRAWGNDRIWLTIHGESMKNMYEKWGPNQPDNYENIQSCGRMLKNGDLDDVACEKEAIFVCEKDPERKKYKGFLYRNMRIFTDMTQINV